jgi:RNA 2',3'-cyclic 3'-phosphodiesterase
LVRDEFCAGTIQIMNQQLSFFREPQSRPAKYNLFLGIFPDSCTARSIIELADTLRQKHGLRGRVRPVSHLHVSLFFLGGVNDVPACAVEAISQVCKTVVAATHPFEISFIRLMSFHGRAGNHPLVFVGDDDGNQSVRKLQGLLGAKFLRGSSATHKFIPHLTLLYDRLELAPEPVGPVFWTVKEIVLVRSEVGATKYDWLGQWKFST